VARSPKRRPDPGAAVGGNVNTAPTFPVLGESREECIVTGLEIARSKAKWSRGRWVHPLAFDKRGYKEVIDNTLPPWDDDPDREPPVEDILYLEGGI